ncbi:MAG: T9SS type A sorting domain-containing protein, partial [Flavobacteriales bacterium]
ATTWEVEVGGNQNITPYFLPQNLTIAVGDEIEWTWVSGQHNLVTTNGNCPDPFDSGDHATPFVWTKTFTLAGTYNYECSLFNHADTQFGVITVQGGDNVGELQANLRVDFNLFPNPASDQVTVQKNCACVADLAVYDLTGKVVYVLNNSADMLKTLQIANLTQGIYIVELNANGIITRKRLLVK